MNEEPKYLMRLFSNEQYTADFILKGHLYMNTLEFFRKLENDNFRGDNTEGALLLGDSGASLKIFRDDESTKVIDLNITKISVDGLIYCFFAFYENQLIFENNNYQWIDENNNLPQCVDEFHHKNGRTFIVLLDYLRIKNKIHQFFISESDIKFPFCFAKVEYGYSSPLNRFEGFLNRDICETAFRKPDSFQHQQEYRLCIRASPIENKTHADIFLGDLRTDILFVGEYKQEIQT